MSDTLQQATDAYESAVTTYQRIMAELAGIRGTIKACERSPLGSIGRSSLSGLRLRREQLVRDFGDASTAMTHMRLALTAARDEDKSHWDRAFYIVAAEILDDATLDRLCDAADERASQWEAKRAANKDEREAIGATRIATRKACGNPGTEP